MNMCFCGVDLADTATLLHFGWTDRKSPLWTLLRKRKGRVWHVHLQSKLWSLHAAQRCRSQARATPPQLWHWRTAANQHLVKQNSISEKWSWTDMISVIKANLTTALRQSNLVEFHSYELLRQIWMSCILVSKGQSIQYQCLNKRENK